MCPKNCSVYPCTFMLCDKKAWLTEWKVSFGHHPEPSAAAPYSWLSHVDYNHKEIFTLGISSQTPQSSEAVEVTVFEHNDTKASGQTEWEASRVVSSQLHTEGSFEIQCSLSLALSVCTSLSSSLIICTSVSVLCALVFSFFKYSSL